MEEKTLVLSEQEYRKIFTSQFNIPQQAELAWNALVKPREYPCVVVKSCGKYTYVYYSDMNPFQEPGY